VYRLPKRYEWRRRRSVLSELLISVVSHSLEMAPCSNLGVGIPEGCFILDFASITLEVPGPFTLPWAQKWP